MLAGPSDVSLQQSLDGTDPEMPLALASDHPPTFFQSQPLESATQLSSVTGISVTIFFNLNALLLISHVLTDSSELFNPGGGLCPLSDQPASAGLRSPPLSELLL